MHVFACASAFVIHNEIVLEALGKDTNQTSTNQWFGNSEGQCSLDGLVVAESLFLFFI